MTNTGNDARRARRWTLGLVPLLAWAALAIPTTEVAGAAPVDFAYAFTGAGSTTTTSVCSPDGCIPAGDHLGGSLSSCAGACAESPAGGELELSFGPTDPYSPADPYKCRPTKVNASAPLTWSDGTTTLVSVTGHLPPNPIRAFRARGTVTSGRFAGSAVSIDLVKDTATSLCQGAAYTFSGRVAFG
jgi:hypothetical protein